MPESAPRRTFMRQSSDPKSTIYDGKHIRVMSKGDWEYVERKKVTGIVGIVAVTDDKKIVLVEQYRPPLGKIVIELPAGLAGDEEDANEEMVTAARRELLEETGYEAAEMVYLADGAASAGITNEVISLFRATGLKKTGSGAGVGQERITVLEIPLSQVFQYLQERRKTGTVIDLKLYGGLYFAK
jgi:ADP-ribose pyrophosphatase